MDSVEDVRYDGTYEPVPDTEGAAQRLEEGTSSPVVDEARRFGYVPLRELTGVGSELGPLWPTQHRQWCEDLGPELGEDENDEELDRWLVRSPWPALSPPQVLIVLWRWVERDPYPHERARWAVRVEEALSWDEATALGLLDTE